MQSAAQNLIDLRAVEIATEARTSANIAREECGRDYRDLRGEVTSLRAGVDTKFDALRISLTAEFTSLRTEAHKGRGAIYNLLWGAVAGIIAILLVIIGFLFVVAYPPAKGGEAVRRTMAEIGQAFERIRN